MDEEETYFFLNINPYSGFPHQTGITARVYKSTCNEYIVIFFNTSKLPSNNSISAAVHCEHFLWALSSR